MEKGNALYYNGTSACPAPVQVLVFEGLVHIYEDITGCFIQSFPLAGATYNQVGPTHYLYLDSKGLMYLQFATNYPLAIGLPKQVSDVNPHWSQKLMKQKVAFLLPLLVLLVLGLYFLLVNLVPFLGMRMISAEQEIKIGDKLKQSMLQQARITGVEIDTAGTRHLQAFADRLKFSDRYPIRLTLLKSKIVNAYALPGGQVVVYDGILEKIKTPEALAALLAHECTHVNERHSLRSILRNAANGLLISILFSDATGISGALVSNVETLNGLRYSRSLEAEADRKGMDLLMANRVDLKGMRQLMQALQEEGDIPNSLSFLSTHPLTKQRIRATDQYIKEHPQKVSVRQDLQLLYEKLK